MKNFSLLAEPPGVKARARRRWKSLKEMPDATLQANLTALAEDMERLAIDGYFEERDWNEMLDLKLEWEGELKRRKGERR